MKKSIRLFIVVMLFLSGQNLFAQISINTDGTNPDGSAMLDIKSTDMGMLIPRMTAAERDLIGTPATGLMVIDAPAPVPCT